MGLAAFDPTFVVAHVAARTRNWLTNLRTDPAPCLWHTMHVFLDAVHVLRPRRLGQEGAAVLWQYHGGGGPARKQWHLCALGGLVIRLDSGQDL